MKKNEVRHGNLVIYGGHQTTIDEKEIIHFVRFSDKYEPIPLTEEWLIEKMKFHKQNNQIYSIGLKLFISWWNTNSIEIDINGEVLEINCKYVHELQNIYFALTGEELTLKP